MMPGRETNRETRDPTRLYSLVPTLRVNLSGREATSHRNSRASSTLLGAWDPSWCVVHMWNSLPKKKKTGKPEIGPLFFWDS